MSDVTGADDALFAPLVGVEAVAEVVVVVDVAVVVTDVALFCDIKQCQQNVKVEILRLTLAGEASAAVARAIKPLIIDGVDGADVAPAAAAAAGGAGDDALCQAGLGLSLAGEAIFSCNTRDAI